MSRTPNSQLPGFYKLSMDDRRARLADVVALDDEALAALSGEAGLGTERADRMIENAIGTLEMPLGVCVNMLLDGRDRLVPMAIEEPSVIAAASHAAKLLRAGGGVTAELDAPHMIGQMQLLDVPDPAAARAAVEGARDDLLRQADACDPKLVEVGGGARDIVVRDLPARDADDPLGPMMVVHLVADVRDAMGANAINTMCETLAPEIEGLTGGRVRLRILSNLADRRTVTVRGRVPITALPSRGGGDPAGVARGIQEASVFAERDPYRAATHNKGIMNGVDAVLIALGQDWRAVEAGAHAYAARGGHYGSLTRWRVEGEYLTGVMTMPMAVGVVGGVVRVHPTVQAALKVAEITSAAELAAAAAAVGLAQNLGALRALADEGIQRGHMRLHARNVAVEAGAEGAEIDEIAARISAARQVNQAAARRVLDELRG